MSTLLPPTPDSMQRILVQGGIPQISVMRASPTFDRLLEETRSLLQSPDFSIVLESCLDRATDTLFKSIKDTIFVRGGSSVDEDGTPLQLRLAGLLPGMARWSHLAFNGFPNELVDVRTFWCFMDFGTYISPTAAPRGHSGSRRVLCHHIFQVRKPVRVITSHPILQLYILMSHLPPPFRCSILSAFLPGIYEWPEGGNIWSSIAVSTFAILDQMFPPSGHS